MEDSEHCYKNVTPLILVHKPRVKLVKKSNNTLSLTCLDTNNVNTH